MAKELEFISQITKNTCEDFQLFEFITNLRNFEQMLPPEVREKVTITEDTSQSRESFSAGNQTPPFVRRYGQLLMQRGEFSNDRSSSKFNRGICISEHSWGNC